MTDSPDSLEIQLVGLMWNLYIYYPTKFHADGIQPPDLAVCQDSKIFMLRSGGTKTSATCGEK